MAKPIFPIIRSITNPKKPPRKRTKPSGPPRSRRTPESLKNDLEPDLWKLYSLIWNRFVASQMNPALFDQTDVQIEAGKSGVQGNRFHNQVRRISCRLSGIETGRTRLRHAEEEVGPARAARRGSADVERAAARSAFHPTAAALQRSQPGESPGIQRNRTAEHLCHAS